MLFPLNPIAIAITSSLFISTQAVAIGGIAGTDGTTSPDIKTTGAFSQGAPAGSTRYAFGENGANFSTQTVTIDGKDSLPNGLIITGTAGGEGGDSNSGNTGARAGATGRGGNGGASIFGASTNGGTGGYGANYHDSTGFGGNGGSLTGNTITLSHATLQGGAGGNGGSNLILNNSGGAGPGGQGGASVFGGFSTGGAGGYSYAYTAVLSPSDDLIALSNANGGAGGDVKNNTIHLSQMILNGGKGGDGGLTKQGGAGLGGNGGGSVFGGFSMGAAAGHSSVRLLAQTASAAAISSGNGGAGGDVTGHIIGISHSRLNGGAGGASGTTHPGTQGAAGHGGGSVFGGFSQGGDGGYSRSDSKSPKPAESAAASSITFNGGNGGNVTGNTITLSHVVLEGAAGGSSETQGEPSTGLAGGSVFGGVSRGGAGGYTILDYTSSTNAPVTITSFHSFADGGNGGNASQNSITIEGKSTLSGNIYGGYSQGGQAGLHTLNNKGTLGTAGTGGRAENNTITLSGDQLNIAGAIYGGYSVNGDGSVNHDKAFKGNTLVLQDFRGSVAGLYNIENYRWVLPKDEFNGDTLITITGDDRVQLDNTKHTIGMENDGNRLQANDTVILIDKVEGTPAKSSTTAEQGHFIVYDVSMNVVDGALVLHIDGKDDKTPAGRISPKAKALLEGRLASLAQVNQGADAISGIGLDAARESVGRCGANLFMFVDGGSNRYETGSYIKLRNTNFGFGAANCFELQSQSQVLVGAFIEHGNGNYDTYNQFEQYDDVHGWGKVRYTGAGMLMHMNVAGTGSGKKEETPSSIARNDGLYLDAAVRAGKAKTRFDSSLVDAQGNKGAYNAKSNYYSVMAGAGYALNLDAKQAVDVYGRYTWSHIGSDTFLVGKDTLHLSNMNSSRLRVGARYHYAATPQVTPYVGLAYEREFSGRAKGTAYGMAIDAPSLKGNTGIAELGLTVVPSATKQALSLNFGVQGYFSDRKGGAASLRMRYAF